MNTLIDKIGLECLLAVLTPEQRRELAKRINGEILKKIINKIGLDGLSAVLTSQQKSTLAMQIKARKK